VVHHITDCCGNVKETVRPYATMQKVSEYKGICGESVVKLGGSFKMAADGCCGNAKQLPQIAQEIKERAFNFGKNQDEEALQKTRNVAETSNMETRMEELHNMVNGIQKQLALLIEMDKAKNKVNGSPDDPAPAPTAITAPAVQNMTMEASDPAPEESNDKGWLSGMKDYAEEATGVDIDGDGDTGDNNAEKKKAIDTDEVAGDDGKQ